MRRAARAEIEQGIWNDPPPVWTNSPKSLRQKAAITGIVVRIVFQRHARVSH